MKTYISIFILMFTILFSCNSTKDTVGNNDPKSISDTVRIANDAIEYEVIIIDPSYSNWLYSRARPRGFHSQSYMESRNRIWITEWNRRVNLPMQYNPNLYEMQVNYDFNIDYGYEVNYLIFNYLNYFQLTYKQQLGGFQARL